MKNSRLDGFQHQVGDLPRLVEGGEVPEVGPAAGAVGLEVFLDVLRGLLAGPCIAARVVALDVDKKTNTVKFLFDLLNKDEFFVFKLLLNGKADIKEFKFTITVDDLPPVLKTKSLPYDLVEIEDADKSSDIEWGLLLAGLVFIILGAPVGYLALDVSATLPDFADKSVFSYISEVPLIWIAKWPTFIVGILILVVGIGMMIGSVSGASLFNKKKKLILPKGIIRSRSFLFREFRLEAKMNREAANDDKEKS